jgi:hypothetical protein
MKIEFELVKLPMPMPMLLESKCSVALPYQSAVIKESSKFQYQ